MSALTPICVAQFRKSANAPANLATLKETKSWEQSDYVGKGGWATMPGSTAEPNASRHGPLTKQGAGQCFLQKTEGPADLPPEPGIRAMLRSRLAGDAGEERDRVPKTR